LSTCSLRALRRARGREEKRAQPYGRAIPRPALHRRERPLDAHAHKKRKAAIFRENFLKQLLVLEYHDSYFFFSPRTRLKGKSEKTKIGFYRPELLPRKKEDHGATDLCLRIFQKLRSYRFWSSYQKICISVPVLGALLYMYMLPACVPRAASKPVPFLGG